MTEQAVPSIVLAGYRRDDPSTYRRRIDSSEDSDSDGGETFVPFPVEEMDRLFGRSTQISNVDNPTEPRQLLNGFGLWMSKKIYLLLIMTSNQLYTLYMFN